MDSKHGDGDSSTNAADPSADSMPRSHADAQTSAQNGVNGTDEAAISKPGSKSSSTRNSTPASVSMDAHDQAQVAKDASADSDAMQESRDASTEAQNPSQPASKDSDENGAVPYGTRSRNRPGRSRPNYAEDTEMDFEMTAAPTNGNSSDPPSRTSTAAEGGQTPGVSGKKGSGSAKGNATGGNAGPISKDSPANPNISGAPSVTAATQPSAAQPPVKRRKNAATTNGNHASAAAPSQAGAVAKRGNQIMVAANSARESNMLTFENTGAVLKDGRMVADDGQTMSINGKLSFVFLAAECHHVAPATSCGFVCGI